LATLTRPATSGDPLADATAPAVRLERVVKRFGGESGRGGGAGDSATTREGGGGEGGGAARSSAAASSSSASRSAIGVLTAIPSAPSATRIRPSVPSSMASISMVALSVSISAITSPAATRSPSALSHLARLPSVMVGESAGIRISVGMAWFLGERPAARTSQTFT